MTEHVALVEEYVILLKVHLTCVNFSGSALKNISRGEGGRGVDSGTVEKMNQDTGSSVSVVITKIPHSSF